MEQSDDLKRVGLKSTSPRLAIMEVFRASNSKHLSAEEILRSLLKSDIHVGLSSIYRALGHLTQAGVLTCNHFDVGAAKYELNKDEHHDHLICIVCGLVVEFHDDEIEARQRDIASARGFALRDHTLALYGRCESCPSDSSPRH